MISNSTLKKIIYLKNHFPKLDDKGALLVPTSLKLKDIEFMKYRHLPVNWQIRPVTGNDLPSEFSPKAVKLIDLFRRKTIGLTYEVMLIFDYKTGELLYCFVNDFGESNEIYGNVDEEVFVGKHVATIHNHPKLYESALSSENFQILELEFEEYELVSSRNALWILKSKEMLPEKDIIEIKNSITTLNDYSKMQSHDNERIYEELLLDYINNVRFNIELTRRLFK
ncbi:hypothetical protein [Methanobrevibacter sp.]|uniref:hypothetical protein n=1 Tax=Methanobrevibacter sp. TaxID=66852 RepID=UPI003870C8C1